MACRTMQRAICALLALFLTGAAFGEVAASEHPLWQALPPPVHVLVETELPVALQTLETVQSLRGYALADELDSIGRGPKAVGFFLQCSRFVSEMSPTELKTVVEIDVNSSIHPALAGRFERLSHLIDVAIEIFASARLQSTIDGDTDVLPDLQRVTVDMFMERARVIDDRSRPVAQRRLMRHSVRGLAALYCMIAQPKSLEFQGELLDHAIRGYESLLRLATGTVEDKERERIVSLGLDPIDPEEWDRQAERLEAARAALEQARSEEPNFRLPPVVIEDLKD